MTWTKNADVVTLAYNGVVFWKERLTKLLYLWNTKSYCWRKDNTNHTQLSPTTPWEYLPWTGSWSAHAIFPCIFLPKMSFKGCKRVVNNSASKEWIIRLYWKFILSHNQSPLFPILSWYQMYIKQWWWNITKHAKLHTETMRNFIIKWLLTPFPWREERDLDSLEGLSQWLEEVLCQGNKLLVH